MNFKDYKLEIGGIISESILCLLFYLVYLYIDNCVIYLIISELILIGIIILVSGIALIYTGLDIRILKLCGKHELE